MYIHGGGFVSGSASSSKGYSSILAKYSGCKVIAVDYSLAPKFPFPHGFNDCFSAFCQIVKLYPEAKITLVEECAGANLCLAHGLKVKSRNKVSCILVHSPFVDFTDSLDRTEHEIDDFTVKQGCLKPLRQIQAGEKLLAIIMKHYMLMQKHYIKNVNKLAWMLSWLKILYLCKNIYSIAFSLFLDYS